jgi:signal transduction histidine kinase
MNLKSQAADNIEAEGSNHRFQLEFIGMLSHELKNPLASIQLAADVLLKYNGRLSNEKHDDYLQNILDKVGFMSNLLEDILAIGSTAATTMQYRPEMVDVRTVTRELLDEQAARYPHVTYEVSFDGILEDILLDTRLFRYILANLLSNAAKYSPQHSTVYLIINFVADELITIVRDVGIGMNAADIAHLYTPFYRGERTEGISGTGLGLAIVKHSVDAHGGSIEFESHVGQGTTVTVKLPIRKKDDVA